MKKQISVPQFENEAQERAYWESINLADHFDPTDFKRASFPNLKPSTKTISLRLPQIMLEDIKMEANAKDVPYQSFIKIILSEHIARVRDRQRSH